MRRTGIWIAGTLTLLAGCAGERSTEALPEWPVSAEARLAVGDSEERDTVVFARVSDARLVAGGLLAVADAGASGIRVFDAQGALVSSAGRRGRGPGEFTGALGLADGPGDSLHVWDPGQSRWSLVAVRAGGIRTLTEPVAQGAWIHAGVLIRSALASPPAWVPPLIQSLSDSSPEVRLAHLDETGVLFVSQDASARRWDVHVDTGAAVARVTLPAGFTLFQFRGDAVVGLVADSSGHERVVVHTLQRVEHRAPDLTPAAAPPADSGARSALMAAMRNAVVAQEVHWMGAQRYTAQGDSLELPMPPGVRFRVLEATERGWRGAGWFTATGYTCGMVVGLTPPIGWSEGEVRCGW